MSYYFCWSLYKQGRRQGKLLEGAKLPGGSRGQRPLAGVQGAEPSGGGQGAKPPEADTFLVLKSWLEALSEHVFPY